MMNPQALAPASFFYYSPDAHADKRHHGHFTSHPGMPHPGPPGHPQAAMHHHLLPVVPTVPSTPLYARPSSSSGPAVPLQAFQCVPAHIYTPVASPQPLAHKPRIMLETELAELDGYHLYPSTPPLSSGGSVSSSPRGSDLLQTPMNPMFSGLDGFDGKKEVELPLESFPVLDWASCASPPLTPVYLPPHAAAQQGPAPSPPRPTVLRQASSAAASCPSLSPSPAPYARSVSSASELDLDFCDPRNLTVGAALPSEPAASGPSALATLSTPDDEASAFLFKGEHGSDLISPAFNSPALSPHSSADFVPELCHGLPSLDDFSDLDSEDDFVNGLVNLGEPSSTSQTSCAPVSRSRASSALSLTSPSFAIDDAAEGFESFEDSHLLGIDAALSPPSGYQISADEHPNKRQRRSESPSAQAMMDATESNTNAAHTEQDMQDSQGSQDTAAATPVSSPSSTVDSNDTATAPTPVPANRRGRKQSLTEDPSKTFVCDICNRRFRRQEHLKRHYRSLHTQDKPFDCAECGKKFSRSDNLAQHARTHGSGAMVMTLLDESMAAAAGHHGFGAPHMGMLGGVPTAGEDYNTLGRVLFQVASELPGSSSEPSSDDDNDVASLGSAGDKKRKRSE